MSTANLETIAPRALDELHRSGRTIDLIDVRTPAEYREVHVKFARNVPLDRLEPQGLMAARNGSCEEPLYVICRSGARGRQACEKFIAAGFSNVVNVEGGTLACVEAQLPCVRGKKTISLDRQVRIIIGFLVMLGTVCGWLVHPGCLVLSAVMGAGVMWAGITDRCYLALLIGRMPWNQADESSKNCCCPG